MRRETKASRRDESNPNPTPVTAAGAVEAPEPGPSAVTVDGADEDELLRPADVLTREEVLRRRSRRMRQLARCYCRHYWALMEELRVKHRDYYWEFGASPLEEDEHEVNGAGGTGGRGPAAEGNGRGALEDSEENGRAGHGVGLGLGFGQGEGGGRRARQERKRCAFSGCKSKAMPLTRFCHPHILLERKQTLYKACSFVTKSCGQSGPTTCGKPVLRAAVPSFCPGHFQKAQKSISQALRRAGLNITSSGRPAPKFSVLIAEYVHQIQARRREALNSAVDNINNMDEEIS